MKMLNLGCGNRIHKSSTHEWIHHDITNHRPEIDIVWDLNILPWPWANEEFGFVAADSVLEHLDHNLLISMNEIWRILKPGGTVHVKLPHWKHEVSWSDPTHHWPAGLQIFDQLCPETERGKEYSFYTPYKWTYIKGPRLNRAKSSIHITLEKLNAEG